MNWCLIHAVGPGKPVCAGIPFTGRFRRLRPNPGRAAGRDGPARRTGNSGNGNRYLFKHRFLSAQNPLKLIYDEVLAKIQQLKAMLDLLAKSLITDQLAQIIKSLTLGQLAAAGINMTPSQIAGLTQQQLNDLINSLTPDPNCRFVPNHPAHAGDKPHHGVCGRRDNFPGMLSAGVQTAGGREITILYDNSTLLKVQNRCFRAVQRHFPTAMPMYIRQRHKQYITPPVTITAPTWRGSARRYRLRYCLRGPTGAPGN